VVARPPRQGEIWWVDGLDKRRPVLIVSRSDATAVLHRILVAPITRTTRGIPTEVALDRRHGLAVECCATFDNLELVGRRSLTERVGALAIDERDEICRALRAMADC
jgi:mRNA interferase MazF